METGHLHHALMRTLGAALACAVVVSSAAAEQAPALTTADVVAFADSFFARYLHEDFEPSLALVVVSGDSVVLSKGYGSENAQRPVDPSSTVFNVASLSKLFVATAAMQLVERGKVTLDGDIEPLLGLGIIGAGPPITLWHLLTHTSGLEGPFLREVVADPRDVMPLGDYFSAYPPRRTGRPGAAARYSNYGMALVGHLIQDVSGETFHDYVERNVFRPLSMTSSSFRQPPPATLADRTATAGTGPIPNALLTYPSGSMVSTPADMSRFMLAHLNGGRLGDSRILSDASVNLIHAAHWRADPRVPGVGLGFFESTIGGEPGLFHTGARGHFSLVYLFPERRVGVFLVHATRQGGAFQSLRSEFIRALAARYFPQTSWPLRRASEVRARQLAGTYRPHLLQTTTIERAAALFSDTSVRVAPDGLLEMKLPAGPMLRLAEIDEGLYRVAEGPEAGLMVVFERDPQGRVRRMSMSGNIQDPVTFERLAWYETGTVHAAILGTVFLVFLGCALGSLAVAGVRLLRRRERSPGPAGARLAWGVAVTAGILYLAAPLSMIALVMTHKGDDAAAEGLRRALSVGCTLLLAGMALAVALVPLGVLAWRRMYWGAPRRVLYYALAAGAVVAAPLLAHYHLLGYWF